MKPQFLACLFVLTPVARGEVIEGLPGEHVTAPSPLSTSDSTPNRQWDGTGGDKFSGPFATVLKELFAIGYPDPAGLPYRKISIATGNCYDGDSGPTETEGWMLPSDKGSERYAIAWNGLIYPVIKSTGDADLADTVKVLLADKEKPFGPFGWQFGETAEVKPGAADILHGLYLTRLGHADAAEALLKKRDDPPADFTRELADSWAWNLYDRAVCAHMRGDVKLALASLRELERIRPALLRILTDPNSKDKPPLAWADQFDELKSECERRIKEGKAGHLDVKKFLATQPEIPALIDALDRIAVMQGGQPADVPLDESPIVKALVAKGEPAVEPLLDCLANDPRLTQSMHFWRDFSQDRTVLGVHEAAVFSLQDILKAEFFTLVSTGDSITGRGNPARIALAEKIRADWEKYRKTTGPQRAYQILADDHASRSAWFFAALSLFPEHRYGDDNANAGKTPAQPIPGEPLRDRKDPSVSDLLEKRTVDCMKSDDKDSDASQVRCRLLACLLRWEPERGRAAITRQTDAWLASGKWKSEVSALKSFIVDVCGEAPDLLRLFEAMAWSVKPEKYDDFTAGETVTTILAKHGASPLLKRSREGLWTDSKSPWCLTKLDISTLEALTAMWREQELTTREPFRSALLAALADGSKCTSIMIDPEDPKRWSMEYGDGTTSMPIPDDKRFNLKAGKAVSVRLKDVIAKTLSDPESGEEKTSMEEMNYWWPESLRDERIGEVIKRLQSPPHPHEKADGGSDSK